MQLVVFDLDGTLIRGRTVVEHVASKLNHRALARSAERSRTRRQVQQSRDRLDAIYAGRRNSHLATLIANLPLAPGCERAFQLLHQRGIRIGIATLTWSFAAEWFRRRFGVHHVLASQRHVMGRVRYIASRDKAIWVRRLMLHLGYTTQEVAAVGDSPSDLPMLRLVGHGYYVGRRPPAHLGSVHFHPEADLGELVEDLLRRTH